MDFLNVVTQYQGQAATVLKEYQLLIGVILLPIIYFIPKIAVYIFNMFKRLTVLTMAIDEAANLSGEVFTHFATWLSENRIKSYTRNFEIDKHSNLRVGVGPNLFKFQGKYFLVYMERREAKGFNDHRMAGVKIMFFKWNLPVAEAFVKMLKETIMKDDGAKILRSDYSSWEILGELPHYIKNQRQYVNKDVYDSVHAIFDRMVNNPDYYKERNIPYKETFFFYGPPRTGKTSLARHLSAHFNLDVMVISPNKLHDLMFSRGRYRNDRKRLTVYLIEDIDANQSLCVGSHGPTPALDVNAIDPSKLLESPAERVVDMTDMLVSKDDLSTLLNTLDGVVPMDNAIVIYSSNFPRKLYKSIYGVGRTDHIVEIGYMNFNEVMHLLNWSADDARYIFMLTYEGRNELPAKTIDMLRHAADVSEIKEILVGREIAATLHTVDC